MPAYTLSTNVHGSDAAVSGSRFAAISLHSIVDKWLPMTAVRCRCSPAGTSASCACDLCWCRRFIINSFAIFVPRAVTPMAHFLFACRPDDAKKHSALYGEMCQSCSRYVSPTDCVTKGRFPLIPECNDRKVGVGRGAGCGTGVVGGEKVCKCNNFRIKN